MIKTGSKDLDEFLEGYKDEITIVYGPAASGKTTLAKLAAIEVTKRNGKAVFIDAENGFSIERLMQLAEGAYIDILDKILLLKVNDFDEQCKKIDMLKDIVGIDLVVVDSLGKYYRKETNKEEANKKLIEQLRTLVHLTRKGVHVLLTDQVYSNMENEICLVGGNMVSNFAKCLIELQKEPRKIVVKKPLNKEMCFRIEDKGIFKNE